MSALPRLMVAPNGARLGKADHPAIPITREEIVADALACQAAGADGLHLHIRKPDGTHLLDAETYRKTVAAVQAACPGLAVQITTEAAGLYPPETQRAVALEAGCASVSVSVREICRDSEALARDFYDESAARGIDVQHILYDSADAELLARLLGAKLHTAGLQLLFVLGRYSADQTAAPADLQPFTDWMQDAGIAPDWAVCAFGMAETACLLNAARLGGKCRVGFENSRLMADGRLAPSNAARVAEISALLAAQH